MPRSLPKEQHNSLCSSGVPTVRDVAENLAGICVPVPFAGEGVCERCHGHPGPGYDICGSCWQVESQLSRPCSLVIPVSLYVVQKQLHHNLLHYKDDRYPSWVQKFSTNVACALCYFLARHSECIEEAGGGPWDVITAVPSSSHDRQGEHPLVRALRRVPSVFASYESLLELGTVPIQHNRASDRGYAPTRGLAGERVLLIDDTFTSGARSQSAASALNLAGADVVAIVPVGRVINPTFGDNQDWWDEQSARPFSFDECCLEE
jgi:hypothetical protein